MALAMAIPFVTIIPSALLATNARVEEVVNGTEVRFVGCSAVWLLAGVPYSFALAAAVAATQRILRSHMAREV